MCLFLLLFYRVLGAIAVGGLIIYGIYFFALIKLIPITLTLPGIAGLILTIGIAADANIVIFERVKEEIRGGRSIISGIATGYKRGFAAIVDANVVTFMTAFILFALATAEVKGFAFTLGIGTLLTLFTAVLATQAALGAMSRSGVVSHPAALGAARRGRGWTFDFMGASKWFFSLSGTILLIGALAIGGKGINFGIDFKSGTRIQTAFIRPVSESEVASAMSAAGYANAAGAEVHQQEHRRHGLSDLHQDAAAGNGQEGAGRILDTRFGNGPAVPGTKNFSSTSIGPTFGKTVANSAIIAIIASLLVISAYIALRFEWKYAVPVLIALMHDLLITAGVYSLTGREVTTATVAALLTILGYSLYDTIIVFDRVRENVPRMPRAAFSQIVNRSMSEVLTRSLATSFCTLLPVHLAAVVRRRNAQELRLRADGGDRLGRLLVDLHRLPGAHPLEGARGRYRNRRARIVRRTRAGARLRDDRRRASPRTSSRRRSASARGAEASSPPRSPVSRSQEKSSRNWCATSTSRGSRALGERPIAASGRRGVAQKRAPGGAGSRARGGRRGASRSRGGPHARGPRAQGRAQATREAQAPAQPPSRQIALSR